MPSSLISDNRNSGSLTDHHANTQVTQPIKQSHSSHISEKNKELEENSVVFSKKVTSRVSENLKSKRLSSDVSDTKKNEEIPTRLSENKKDHSDQFPSPLLPEPAPIKPPTSQAPISKPSTYPVPVISPVVSILQPMNYLKPVKQKQEAE